MNIILRTIGLFGLMIFGLFFYFTFSIPGYVEEVGKDFVKFQIEKQTNQKIDSIQLESKEGKLAKLAAVLYKNQQKKIESFKSQLKNKVDEKLTAVISEMRDLSCQCREKYSKAIKAGYQYSLISLQSANEKLLEFMKTKYMEVVSELKRDIRIFTGSNTLIFLLLLLISFLKPKVVKHLFLPGVLLLVSTLVCSFFYIFEQNWLLTIIYNNYLGFAYLGYISVVFLLLCDIVFNQADITTRIINGLLNAIGSGASLSSC